jgi:23S rRNA-/tRNA-specific pseudouridylate synthase
LLCRKGLVLLSDELGQTTSLVHGGEDIKVLTRVQSAKVLPTKNGPPALEIAYEDEHMAAVVKPQGMITQGRGGAVTASECIKYCLTQASGAGTLASVLALA